MSSVLITGASGLVGRQVLALLLASPQITRIIVAARKAPASHPKITCYIDARLQSALEQVDIPVDTVFCCLGTTQKEAGSKAAFRAVDYDMVVATGEAGKRLGATHMLVVSAMGADAASWFFYNRVKGETEQALISQHWPRLTIARPSMLLGHRDRPRLLERLSSPLFQCLPGRWKAIQSADVARAMVYYASRSGTVPVEIKMSANIRQDAALLKDPAGN